MPCPRCSSCKTIAHAPWASLAGSNRGVCLHGPLHEIRCNKAQRDRHTNRKTSQMPNHSLQSTVDSRQYTVYSLQSRILTQTVHMGRLHSVPSRSGSPNITAPGGASQTRMSYHRRCGPLLNPSTRLPMTPLSPSGAPVHTPPSHTPPGAPPTPLRDTDACARPVPSGTKQKCRANPSSPPPPKIRFVQDTWGMRTLLDT